MEKEQIKSFVARRALIVFSKHMLKMLEDLRAEHDTRFEEAGQSLVDMEEFLSEKHNVQINLIHLANHMQFFDDDRFQRMRKSILDISNNLQREISQ